MQFKSLNEAGGGKIRFDDNGSLNGLFEICFFPFFFFLISLLRDRAEFLIG